jgi:hypothetical protein
MRAHLRVVAVGRVDALEQPQTAPAPLRGDFAGEGGAALGLAAAAARRGQRLHVVCAPHRVRRHSGEGHSSVQVQRPVRAMPSGLPCQLRSCIVRAAGWLARSLSHWISPRPQPGCAWMVSSSSASSMVTSKFCGTRPAPPPPGDAEEEEEEELAAAAALAALAAAALPPPGRQRGSARRMASPSGSLFSRSSCTSLMKLCSTVHDGGAAHTRGHTQSQAQPQPQPQTQTQTQNSRGLLAVAIETISSSGSGIVNGGGGSVWLESTHEARPLWR